MMPAFSLVNAMTLRHKLFLIIFVLVLLPGSALPNPQLTPDNQATSIRQAVSLLSETAALEPEQVLAGSYDARFEKYDKPYVPQNLSHPFWLKMQFTAPPATAALLLVTNARLFKILDIYINDGSSNSSWQHTALGLSRTKPANVPPVPFFAVPFSPSANSSVTIYARIETSMLEEMDWFVSTERYSPALYSRFTVGIGPMLGIIFALAITHFSLSFTSGYAHGSFWLGLMTLFSALIVAAMTQEIYQVGIPYTYELILFLSYLGMTVLLQLSRAILETRKFVPWLDRWVHRLSLLYALAFPISILADQKSALSTLLVSSAAGQFAFIALCVISYREKLPSRHFYTLGMGAFWLGIVIATIGILGPFNYASFSKQCYVGGLVLQNFVFSLALNRHIRNVRLEHEQLEHKAALASAESRTKSEFLAVMSHEIRTPLNGVLGMIELLQDTPLDETQRYYGEAIRSSGRTLLTVINDILDFSKIEAGKLELEATPFCLDKVIIELIAPYRINFSGKDIEFLADIAPGTPNNLMGDPTRLQQTINNLLSNAFKFTVRGQIRLHVEADEASGSHVVLRFSVSDTGIGISEETQRKLFNAFQQAGTDTARKYGGTGLGLAICKRLVEAMNGHIGVESVPGAGSTFYFTAELQRCAPEQKPMQNAGVSIHAKHFLIVDDHPGYLELIRFQMSFLGLSMDTAKSHEDALTKMEKKVPDLILIDKDLKDTDGFEVARQLRSNPRYSGIPLLMVTASSSIPGKAVLNESGIQAAAVKPVSTEQLKNLLTQTFAIRGSTDVIERSLANPTSSHRVLVAEDNIVNREVIRGLLRKLGITPTVVDSGTDAVTQVCHGNFDIVLMDYEMPDLDGCQATQQIRNYERTTGKPATPIYALTAHAIAEFELRTREAGMNGHLTKPVNFQELAELLRQIPAAHRTHT